MTPTVRMLGTEEVRELYFYEAFGMPVSMSRIISFGKCNFACPYCKRDCQFMDFAGNVIVARDMPMSEVEDACRDAVSKGQVVRFSGGDPCMFPRETLALAKLVKELGGRFSIAHNGSAPRWAMQMAEFGMQSAAIDIKGTRQEIGTTAGIPAHTAEKMYERSIETQDLLSSKGVLVDIRTPVFGHTTLEDMLEIASDISQAGDRSREFWTWRVYKPVRGCSWQKPDLDLVNWMISEVKKEFPTLKIGLRAKWEPNGFLFF